MAYKADGALDFTEVDADANPFTLTGLDPETEYTVKVKPVCEVEKWSDEITFTTDVACPTPSNIAVTTTPFTAEVSWLGDGEDYDIKWCPYSYTPSTNALWLQYDNGIVQTNVGNSTIYTWNWGVMYPSTTFEGNTYLNKVAFYETSYYLADAPITISIYSGGDTAPGTLLYTQETTCLGTVGIHEVALPESVSFDPEENLWIILTTTTIDRPMAMCNVDEANGRWVYSGGNWIDIGSSLASVSTYSFMVRGFIDNTSLTYDWTTETGINTPYTITGLTPETDYLVRIKSNCGGDGESDWSAYLTFTTPSNCAAPFDLEAEPLDESATLSWTGYQDKFNVRYRTAGYYEPVWEDDFENSLNEWTIIEGENAEPVGTNAVWYTIDPTGGLSVTAHSGNYCASSWSWNTNTYYANNWLITPQLELQGVAKYYVRTNAGYPDKYEVLLSTTTTDTISFNVTLKAMEPAPAVNEWTEVIIDLKDYEGQTGYIAFHHLDYDMNYLLIDDFGIYQAIDAGAWTTLNNQNSPVAITTETGTAYEWQAQGVYAGCDGGVTAWSEMASFTTYDKVYDDTTWGDGGATTLDDNVLLIHDVIIPDGVIAYANSITLEAGAHLIIEDGGQLYTN